MFQVSQERELPTANKCPDAKRNDGKSFSRCGSSRPAIDKKDDLNRRDPDSFLQYWIKLYNLVGSVRDELHPGNLARVFVDTGANCNIISRRFFRGLVAEFIKGPEAGVSLDQSIWWMAKI